VADRSPARRLLAATSGAALNLVVASTRKNLFDLRRVAVVHNLHVIARQPVTDSYQLAA